MNELRISWWVFALRGGFAILFAVLLFFASGLLGTIFFDPVMLVSFSLLLGFFILGNGLIFGVAAVFAHEHHLHLWWVLLIESILAIALGCYIGASLVTTAHSLAYLAGLHSFVRVFSQLHLGFKLRQDRPYAAILTLSAVLSLAMAILFLTHRDESVHTIVVWLSGYELVYGAAVVAFALGLHRQILPIAPAPLPSMRHTA